MEQEDKYPDNFVDVGITDYGTIYHKDANGKYHNPYGPAIIWPDGSKIYYIHGKRHRTDGPARIYSDGYAEYYVNGNQLSEEEFNKLYGKKEASLKLSSEEDKYPDTFVDVTIDDAGIVRHNDANGKLHNPYGPAIIWPNGTKVYYIHGKLHRTDGPAIIYPNGSKEYWVNGKQLSEKEFNKLYGKKEASLKLI